MENRSNFKRKLAKVYQINFGMFCNNYAKIPRHKRHYFLQDMKMAKSISFWQTASNWLISLFCQMATPSERLAPPNIQNKDW
jgi:hypothetical protein